MKRTLWIMAAVLLLTVSNSSVVVAQTGMARVRVVHAASSLTAVDVFVNGERALANMSYATMSDYLSVPAGTPTFAFAPAGQDAAQAVIAMDTTVEAGQAYSVAAVGLPDVPAVVVTDDLAAPPSGKARVRVIHLSPDAPGADVQVVNGPTLIPNLAFPQASAYLDVDEGRYSLQVVPNGEHTAFIRLPDTPLKAGTIYDVVAVGRLADIQVVVGTFTPSGSSGAPLTMPTTGGDSRRQGMMLVVAGIALVGGWMLRVRSVRTRRDDVS